MQKRMDSSEVRAGLIGCGAFGTGIFVQSQRAQNVNISVIADKDVKVIRRALDATGITNAGPTDDVDKARVAIEQGKLVVTLDPSLPPRLPLDVIIEATGEPVAGAVNAQAAIEVGKHVVMVNKEADSVVGPVLHRMAVENGLRYWPVDGDQHGLAIRMARWARSLGLEVIMAGKARDLELVVDFDTGAVSCHREMLELTEAQRKCFRPTQDERLPRFVEERISVLGELGAAGNWDLVELAITANALGLSTHDPILCPPLYLSELPYFCRLREDDGGLNFTGTVDAFTCLRRSDEAGMGGGVFIVVKADDDYSNHILRRDGPVVVEEGLPVLLTRPYHLLGVEAVQTIRLIGSRAEQEDPYEDYEPRYDVVTRATEDLPARTLIGDDSDPRFSHFLAASNPRAPSHPLPFHLVSGRPLTSALKKGEVLTVDSIEGPDNCPLWNLRRKQDAMFGLPLV